MATIAKQTIYLNLRPGAVMPVLHVSQGDSGLEALEFKLINGSQPWPIPAAVTDIQLNGTTPVGVFSYSDPTWSGNTVTANVTETMTAERGLTLCELRLLDSTLNSIGTLNFVIAVEPSPYTNAHVSTSDMAVITESLNGSQRNMLLSKSWAIGNTGMRDGEDTNNSKYWSEVSDDNGQRWATGTVDGAPVPSTDPAYHNNSKYWSEQSDINGERWSVGKINGADVPSSDETHHNNSKWWSSISESWAVGGTGDRTGEDTNNSKYWSAISHQYANEVSYKKVYESVAEMKADDALIDGQICRTLGYYTANDGGGALYQMHTTAPTGYSESITNGLHAELIVSAWVSPEMYGAKGDGTTDDFQAFSRMLSDSETKGINWFVLRAKTYILSDELNINRAIKITGQNNTRSLSRPTLKSTATNKVILNVRITSGCIFEDFNVDGTSVCAAGIYFVDNSYHHYLRNVQSQNSKYGFSLGRAWNITFEHCSADGCTDGFRTTGTVTSSTWKDCVVYNCDNGWNITGACVYSSLISCGADHTKRALWLYSAASIVLVNFGAEDYESLASVYGKAIFIGVFTYNRRTVASDVYTLTGTGTIYCYSCEFNSSDTFSVANFYGVMTDGGVSAANNITPARIKTLEDNTANVPSFGVHQETATITTTTSNVSLAHSLTSANCNLIGLAIYNGQNVQTAWFPWYVFEGGFGCTVRWNDSNFCIVKRVDATHINVTVSGSYGVRVFSAYFGGNSYL